MTASTTRDAPSPARAAASATKTWIRALQMTAPIQANPERTFPVLLEELAHRFGEAPALISPNQVLSFRGLGELANRCARWAISEGFVKGDSIGLMMPNSAEYMAIWLGLSGLGCIVALLNSNLAGASLAHCINAAAPKAIIVAANLHPELERTQTHLNSRPRVFVHGGSIAEKLSVDRVIAEMSGLPLDLGLRSDVTIKDTALYIYTSGTTGFPKAARVSHHRIMAWSHWFSGLMGITPQDRLYNCLPMYHSVGGVAAPAALLAGGGSVVIREKFSASQFWGDIEETDCTIFQYIGELCRYLLSIPASKEERNHGLRLCCGNGLSADVWRTFQDRYQIPEILEFYAATEGTFSLFNVEGVPGSIGRVPSFLPQSAQVRLVKYDVESDSVMRGEGGFCVPCGPDEPGEAIGRIADDGGSKFEGYTAEADTQKKVLRNVFKAGDAWFRTGDLMVKDKKGFFYFVDRIGDTFRWKGENVSTCEVRDVIAGFPGVEDVVVYGVSVPCSEGRAGMAMLVADQTFCIEKLGLYVAEKLPSYARPCFLRLAEKIDVTSTFKHKRSELAREGFDPRKIGDRLYFRDPKTQNFTPLDEQLYDRMASGAIKL